MNIEEETFKLYERMKKMFDIEMSYDAGCKWGEPAVRISYEVPNQDLENSEPMWGCKIFSYMVEIKDIDGYGKRRYNYWAESLEELVKMVTKAIEEAETQYDLVNMCILKRFGDEDGEVYEKC